MTTDASVAPPVAAPPPKPPTAKAIPRRSNGSRLRSVLRHALLIAAAFVMLYPLLWMVASSLRPDNQIFSSYGIFVNTFDTSHYPDGWNALARPFGSYLLNSAIVVLGAIVGNLVSCSMAAYAFARLEFPFKRTAFAIMLLTIMLPVHVVIVPQYILWANLGLINTFVPLIAPKLLATDAFFIFLMVQFIRGIPRELDEAARIDGAGHARIFLRIILPLMTPALATTAIFTFIWTWNDFFTQLIFLTDPDKYTVPVALRSFIDAQENSSFGSLFAMSVVSLVPIFLAFLLGQRYLIQGIATTGGK
ncbi:carbohydrate ABC transporter permease [Kineosporia mesophila]|uniref:Carbohydrate ABC transporter permease n=1 Tax=Kineosporia mesophila TaxID=566012 RepID=A0ABP6ZAV9_9ACTN